MSSSKVSSHPSQLFDCKLGRVCTSCREKKSWDQFDKKPRGINERDSRCKKCISKQKFLLRQKKAASKTHRSRRSSTVLNLSEFTIEKIYHPISEEMYTAILKDFVDLLISVETDRFSP